MRRRKTFGRICRSHRAVVLDGVTGRRVRMSRESVSQAAGLAYLLVRSVDDLSEKADFTFFPTTSAETSNTTKRKRKIKKKIFAIPAAAPATAPNPSAPAMTAITAAIMAHLNIEKSSGVVPALIASGVNDRPSGPHHVPSAQSLAAVSKHVCGALMGP